LMLFIVVIKHSLYVKRKDIKVMSDKITTNNLEDHR
jgi:hypothetical protein